MTSIIIGLLAGANFNFALLRNGRTKDYFAQWALIAILTGGAFAVISWDYQPSLAGPFFGLAGVVVLLGWALGFLLARGSTEDSSWGPFWCPVILLMLYLLRAVLGWEMFNTSSYHRLIGAVEQKASATTLAPTDNSHIRMVGLEQARWKANKVLGEAGTIGSKYHVGELTIQMVNGRLQWIAPLEFNGFRHWQSSVVTPGYVTVDAEDANPPAQLVTKLGDKELKLRYLPSSCFGDYLKRHVYNSNGGRYRLFKLGGWHFEVDDEGNPHWVVALAKPTVQWGALKIEGCLVIDAQTGTITETQPAEAPAWVDRVVPAPMAVNYLDWHGEYADGWWNSVWKKDGVWEATGDRVEVVYGADGRCQYFTGLTSTSSTDQALLGIALMDCRTGKTERFAATGAHEGASVEAVNAAVRNYAGYHGTEAIPYLLYGELAFVVPVVSESNLFQRLAIVRASNSQVALGTDKKSALSEYQRMLATGGGNSTSPESVVKATKVTFKVDRITADVQNGTTVWLLWNRELNRMFSATSKVNEQIPNLREGDSVTAEFLDGTSPVTPIGDISIEWK
jgi:hypothetical protein